MDNAKHPLKSKTLWVAAITSVLALFAPGVSDWIAQNPALCTAGLSAIFAALRVATKGKLSLGDN